MRLTPRNRLLTVAVVSVVAVACTVIVVMLLRGDSVGPGADGVRGEGTGGQEGSLIEGPFRISGDAAGPLSPGRAAPIDVELTNPAEGQLRVTALRVQVQAVTAPNADERHPCSPLDYAVSQVPSGFAVTVPAQATRSLSGLGVPEAAWPRVHMIDAPVNQDGCKGASVTLSYVGSGSLGP